MDRIMVCDVHESLGEGGCLVCLWSGSRGRLVVFPIRGLSASLDG